MVLISLHTHQATAYLDLLFTDLSSSLPESLTLTADMSNVKENKGHG